VRSLVNLNSRFDQYMRGDSKALSKQEIHGFNLFMGQAKCGTCHYMPLFNGVFPPAYDRIETEVIGVPGPAASASTGTAAGASTSPAGPKGIVSDSIDEDTGIYGILPILFLRHSFKVPTVRNAARTSPYMHNGVYQTLEEVIDFYDKGGGKVDNQTLPTDSLHLSTQDKKDLIAFIKSLDSH
jgi:cytochrome c peroxidase